MSFSENLGVLMEKRGISSCKLARDLGVHATTIANWKVGKSPTAQHLIHVADYFNVSIDELLRDCPKE